MSNPDSPLTTISAEPLTLEALQDQYNALRKAFNITLVMLLILTGSLFVFFLREVSLARRQINELTQVIMEYEKNVYPVMENFRAKLQLYTQTHPDFGPIYARYFGVTNTLPSGPAPGQAQPVAPSNPARMPPTGGR